MKNSILFNRNENTFRRKMCMAAAALLCLCLSFSNLQAQVAKIGGNYYTTLQAALDDAHTNMTADKTIELIADINGYSIVHQKAGLNLTIEGNGHTVAGQIIVDGDGRASGTETLTIQNVAFNDDGSHFYSGLDGFIMVPSTKTTGTPYYTNKYNYAHNIRVNDCSFTSTSSSLDVVGFKANSGAGNYNTVLNHVTGDNLHSLAQFTGTTGATITNDTITNSQSFVNVNGGEGNFTISNCSYTGVDPNDGYAVRENGSSSANITLTNNSFSANKVFVLGKNGSQNPSGTINVESGNYNGIISKETVAGSTSTFSFTGGTFDQPTATVQDWCASGYGAVDNHDGTCTVMPVWVLTYDGNGNDGGSMDPVYVPKTKPDTVIAACGYTHNTLMFLKWNTQAGGGGDNYYPTNPFTLSSDTTLYAQWGSANTITYNNNGGTGTIANQTKPQGETIVLSDGTGFSKTDHTLYRWNTTADEAVGSTDYALGANYSTDADLNLYAVWRLNLDMQMNATDVSCHDKNDGADTVKIIGGDTPFQIVLSSTVMADNDTVKNLMDRTYIFTGLKPGDYNVQLTDVLTKDTIRGTFSITEPLLLEITGLTVPKDPCPLMGSGTYDVSVAATGGNTGGYHYAWSEAAVANDAATTTVVSGADDRDSTYTVAVTVTDSKNCEATATTTFTVSHVIADDETVHSNSTLTIDTIRQGIMTGCDTILREYGTPKFTTTIPGGYPEDRLVIVNDIPTSHPDSVFYLGENKIIWTATDTCGQSITGEQVIIIYHYPCPDVTVNGKVYHSVRLVCDCWMSENLETTVDNSGADISNLMSYESPTHPDAAANAAIYGYLYDWNTALDAASGVTPDADGHVQGLCPTGWHIPSDLEFMSVAGHSGPIDMSDLRYNDYWLDGGGNNSTGFSLLPGGCYNDNTARYENILGNAYLWSVNSSNPSEPKVFWADCKCYMWQVDNVSPNNGYSIRCVKD